MVRWSSGAQEAARKAYNPWADKRLLAGGGIVVWAGLLQAHMWYLQGQEDFNKKVFGLKEGDEGPGAASAKPAH